MPRTSASKTVSPAVECTRTSPAARTSLIRSVKPMTVTRGWAANAARSCPATSSARPQRTTTRTSPRAASAARVAPPRSPTPHPPPETTTIGASRSSPRSSRAARSSTVWSKAADVSPRTGMTHASSPAIARISSSDSGWIVRCRSQARMRPEAQRGEVGHGRDDRDVHAPARLEHAERLVGQWVGADDDVRPRRPQRGLQPAPGERGEHARRESARRTPAAGERVLDVEQRREAPEDRLGAGAHAGPHDRARHGQRVDDVHLRCRPGRQQPVADRARREIVPFADVGTEDQDAHRGRA